MINQTQITELLAPVKGVTFAAISYKTDVAPAAANKHIKIEKRTSANVQLFNHVLDYKNVYLKAVKRTADKIESNDKTDIDNFQLSESYFTHSDDCFSIVEHKKTGKPYLFAIFNSVQSSEYTIDGKEATKEEVAELLTPSAKKSLLEPEKTVYNAKNDIEHKVIVRTISLENLESLKAVGKVL